MNIIIAKTRVHAPYYVFTGINYIRRVWLPVPYGSWKFTRYASINPSLCQLTKQPRWLRAILSWYLTDSRRTIKTIALVKSRHQVPEATPFKNTWTSLCSSVEGEPRDDKVFLAWSLCPHDWLVVRLREANCIHTSTKLHSLGHEYDHCESGMFRCQTWFALYTKGHTNGLLKGQRFPCGLVGDGWSHLVMLHLETSSSGYDTALRDLRSSSHPPPFCQFSEDLSIVYHRWNIKQKKQMCYYCAKAWSLLFITFSACATMSLITQVHFRCLELNLLNLVVIQH